MTRAFWLLGGGRASRSIGGSRGQMGERRSRLFSGRRLRGCGLGGVEASWAARCSSYGECLGEFRCHDWLGDVGKVGCSLVEKFERASSSLLQATEKPALVKRLSTKSSVLYKLQRHNHHLSAKHTQSSYKILKQQSWLSESSLPVM